MPVSAARAQLHHCHPPPDHFGLPPHARGRVLAVPVCPRGRSALHARRRRGQHARLLREGSRGESVGLTHPVLQHSGLLSDTKRSVAFRSEDGRVTGNLMSHSLTRHEFLRAHRPSRKKPTTSPSPPSPALCTSPSGSPTSTSPSSLTMRDSHPIRQTPVLEVVRVQQRSISSSLRKRRRGKGRRGSRGLCFIVSFVCVCAPSIPSSSSSSRVEEGLHHVTSQWDLLSPQPTLPVDLELTRVSLFSIPHTRPRTLRYAL